MGPAKAPARDDGLVSQYEEVRFMNVAIEN